MSIGPVEVDRNGLEVLDRPECLRLLAGATLGRVGVTSKALPSVLPVNFRVGEDQILFRTGHGTKLAAATRNTVVAFEADDFDTLRHTGWSVMVTGVARQLTEPDELRAAEALHIPRWAPGDDGHVVSVSIEVISGRRIVRPGPQQPTTDRRVRMGP
jgi:nitroimidazol reductase NimA-like FMN-containing flavoprotein (pyridoxamine 5'-phosphate oxidase superfamily)